MVPYEVLKGSLVKRRRREKSQIREVGLYLHHGGAQAPQVLRGMGTRQGKHAARVLEQGLKQLLLTSES